MSDSFVHLHNHTAHSVLDGMAKLDDACAAAAADNQPAIAITDHGTMSGAWKFQNAARAHGIRPIMGIELYLSIGSRAERNEIEVPRDEDSGTDVDDERGATRKATKTKRYEHLTVLARNSLGWRNLVKINNAAQDSYFYKPRADFDLIAEHAEGLVVLTGCLGGPILSALAAEGYDAARDRLAQLRDIVEPGSLFVEVMDHGVGLQRKLMPDLLRLAREFGLPTVATNDAHYTDENQAHAHDAMLCVNANAKIADTDRFRFNGSGYYLRSADQMRALFDHEHGTEDACNSTLLIAEMCEDSVIPDTGLRLPQFPLPDGVESSVALLKTKVRDGAHWRYGNPYPAEVAERLNTEFRVIRNAGLADYFLIVADLIDWSRENGIRVGPGWGSAAGCAISYCLGIVNIDPIANHLLFERFLNPERAGMPDIDIDFDSAGRDRAIDYLVERYGTDRVARIGTFGFARTKRAIVDAARVLGTPEIGAELSSLVPKGGGGKPLTFTEMRAAENATAAEAFLEKASESTEHSEVVRVAESLEGCIASEGVHACGVIVGDEPLDGLIPTRRDRRKGHNNMVVTQWDGPDCEAFGLLKLDALALRNLDVVSACVDNIAQTTGEIVDADNPPTDNDDPRVQATWNLIGSGKTSGLFQIESSGMTDLCESMGADSLDDLAAIVALYRPGPLGAKMHERYVERKTGREEVDYGIFTDGSPNAEAEEALIASVLDTTFGIPVYQEQQMRLGNVVAGFSPVETNRLRKAISKKNREEMARIGEAFISGAITEQFDDEGNVTKIAFARSTAERLWDSIKASGDYSFNASHSYGYGWLAYITAFLKANWPAQYGAALLSVTPKADKRHAVLTSLASEGITVARPDINKAQVNTTVDDLGVVHLGLSEVKGVGEHARWIVYERERNGPFRTLHDFMSRVKVASSGDDKVPTKNMPVSIAEALIEAGGLDCLDQPRLGMFMAMRAARDADDIDIPDIEYGPVERSRRERDRLGMILDEHPLHDPEVANAKTELGSGYETALDPLDPDDLRPDAAVLARCVIGGWSERSWSGGRMAAITLEGPTGSIEGVMWDSDLKVLMKQTGVPELGTVVDMRGWAKMRRTVTRDEESDEEIIDEKLSLSISRILPVKFKDKGKARWPKVSMLTPPPVDADAENTAPPEDNEPPRTLFESLDETQPSIEDRRTEMAAVAVVDKPMPTEQLPLGDWGEDPPGTPEPPGGDDLLDDLRRRRAG